MIDWSRPIENDYGPCKLLHKLKNDLNPNYVVLSLSETGREVCLEFNENGHSRFPDYALRNTIARAEFFIPIFAHKSIYREDETILEIDRPQKSMPVAGDYEHALKIVFVNEKPVSVELLTLPKDPK